MQSAEHIQVEAFAARLGVELEEAPLDGAMAQLVVWAHGKRARIVLSTRLSDPGKRRFAIAHELGHFVLRHPAGPAAALCGPPHPHEANHRDFEAEADTFAHELLTPTSFAR